MMRRWWLAVPLVLVLGLQIGVERVRAACPSRYIVQRGDYLYRIARTCGTTVPALKTANGLQTDTIYVGQSLVIPGGSGQSAAEQPAPRIATSGSGSSHVVRRGDNLYRIARQYATTVAAVKAANGLTTDVIYIGQTLAIPGGSGSSSAPAGASQPNPAPAPSGFGGERLVLANYFVWYDEHLWPQGATWDVPIIFYNSDHRSTVERHLGWARQAGLDGFAVHWYQAGNRTDSNLRTVLDVSQGTSFRSAVTVVTHTQPGVSRQQLVENLRYVLSSYGQHPNYLRLGGRPVLFFADLPRVPLDGSGTAQSTWRSIRAEVDPQRTSIWIAEGLDPSYLVTFDGLYVYKVDHACCPGSYGKAARWAGWVQQYEARTGQPRLWVGTLQPGWDDTRSAGRPDLREPAPVFARDRGNGSYFQATFNAVIGTNPDLLLIHSFNEWIEGSQIEPGATYGDRYLALTAQLAAQFRGQ